MSLNIHFSLFSFCHKEPVDFTVPRTRVQCIQCTLEYMSSETGVLLGRSYPHHHCWGNVSPTV